MNKMTLGLVAASLAASTTAFAQNEDVTQDSRYSFVQASYIPYQNLDTEYGDVFTYKVKGASHGAEVSDWIHTLIGHLDPILDVDFTFFFFWLSL